MNFKKFPEIENSYQQKHIDRWLERYPELTTEKYIVTEKLDGANFQIAFNCNDKYQTGSRNQWVGTDFYNCGEVLEKYASVIEVLKYLPFAFLGAEVRVYFEYIGPKIQGRIYYGDERSLVILAIRSGDYILSPKATLYLLEKFSLTHMYAPIIGIFDTLEEALNVNIEFNSKVVKHKADNLAEGVVIQPYNNVYASPVGELFILKKRNEKFSENKKKEPKVVNEPEVKYLNEAFKTFINENRVLSAFSKHGEIKENTEIKKYIDIVLEDAKKDFLKEYEEEFAKLEPKQHKKVFNVGGMIVDILVKYL